MMSPEELNRIEKLENADIENARQHAEILKLLKPISDTYTTVGKMAKWFMAFLVLLSVLGGVILTWGKILINKN